MDFRDYYQTLGISKSATADDIKKAYRKLARKYHPDVNPGDRAAEAKFKALNEAHEVLGDPEKRRKYDQLGANWKQYENVAPGSGWPFGGFRDTGGGGGRWNVNFGGDTGGRTMSEEEVHEMFGENPFSDFFHTFFADQGPAGARGRPPRKRRGRDVEHTIELSLEQAFHGVTQRFSIGSSAGAPARTVEVRIPPGVIDGSRVRVANEGEPGQEGGHAGHLFLRVRLTPHPTFGAKGQNLYVETKVPVTTAVLGGEVEVPTLDGTALRLRIPPSTQPGQVFRLKGRGLPGLGRRSKGDLYATVQVTLPKKLSAEARAHYEALASLDGKKVEATTSTRTKQSAV